MGKDDAILTERKIGMIMPPPEIKKIIDKAAELVGKYGSNIEGLMKNEEKNLPKFSFLKPNDPYRPYYDYKVSQVAKNINSKIKPNDDNHGIVYSANKDAKIFLGKKVESSIDALSNFPNKLKKNNLQDEIRKLIEEKKMDKEAELKAPPQDQYSISHPNVNPLEMDLIKLTAQFVARNGQRFLTGLSEREAKNTQFDFLKPQHNLFGYFTYLVESYSKCLLPKKEDQIKLQNLSNSKDYILRRCTDRYLWEKKSKENQKKKDKVDEIERAQMAQIDWYDFIVVDIIEFTEEELNNTVPITSNNQNANVNISSFTGTVNILLNTNQISTGVYSSANPPIVDIALDSKEKKDDVVIMDENEVINNSKKLLGLAAFEKENREKPKLDERIDKVDKDKIEMAKEDISKMETKEAIIPAIPADNFDKSLPEPGMKIVSNYKRKHEKTGLKKVDMQKCPLCNESIPSDELSQHMKIELLDPKWKEINKEIAERKMEVSLAPTSDFINYLGEFARDRPDLFGDDVNDIIKIEEWKKLETKYNMQNIKWDGFAPNMSRTTANIAMLAQQTKKNYEESRKQDKIDSVAFSNTKDIVSDVNKPTTNLNASSANNVAISVTQQNAVLNSKITSNTNQPNTGKNTAINESHESLTKKLVENLVPEDVWIRKNPNSINLNIKIPETCPHENWGFKGQVISMLVKPKEKLFEIKQKIIVKFGDAPTSSVLIRDFYNNILNEDQSVAYYNFENNSFIELVLI